MLRFAFVNVLSPAELFLLSFGIFAAGLCIGSYLNVCIWRIPRGESTVSPGSHCPKCGTPIRWFDNIPLLSYLALRGRCRRCAAPISPRYFLGELATGSLFLLLFAFRGFSPLLPFYWFFTAALVFAAGVDFDHFILPDRVTLGGMLAGPVLSAAFPFLHHEALWSRGLAASAFGLAMGFGILYLVSVAGRLALRRDAMGFGDVKLLGAVGACLGWQAVLFTVFFASLSGTLAGLALVAFGGKKLASRIPFGPHLAAAAILWMMAGERIVSWYLGLFAGGF